MGEDKFMLAQASSASAAGSPKNSSGYRGAGNGLEKELQVRFSLAVGKAKA